MSSHVALFYHKKSRAAKRATGSVTFCCISLFLFSIAPCKTLPLVTKSISPLFRLLSVPERQLVTNLSGLMPPQKAAYSVQKQDVSREAGGHGCSSGEAMVTTSFRWDLYTKMLCKLYETALRLQRGFLQRD